MRRINATDDVDDDDDESRADSREQLVADVGQKLEK